VKRQREISTTAKPLSVAERKALVAEVAKTATGKAKRGMAMIDFRDPAPGERAFAETLAGRGALARKRAKKAA